MRTIRGWRGLRAEDQGASLAFGAFDGVHRGHQRVIAAAAEEARRLDVPLGAVAFEPHPWRWFHPDDPPFLLTNAEQQARQFAALGVERLYVLPFDDHLAGLSAEDFAREVLADGLAVHHVIVGFDTTFGRGRTGDSELLRSLGERLGFGATARGSRARAWAGPRAWGTASRAERRWGHARVWRRRPSGHPAGCRSVSRALARRALELSPWRHAGRLIRDPLRTLVICAM